MDATSDSTPAVPELRDVPAVDFLLKQPPIAKLLEEHPRGEVLAVLRSVLEDCRAAIRAGQRPPLDVPTLGLALRQGLRLRLLPNLRRVINATGIVLHTGLGRAPLPEDALEAIAEVATGYCNLELELDSGRRGDRHEHVRGLLRELTGAEDALVVNNNAAATYLTLHALAAGRAALVSRGQLVEIGGSYRMPDIMAAAGCHMVEVGTTNRTRLGDYERALTPETAILLHVHTSNYRIRGFVETTPVTELVDLARRHGLLVVDDLGSGLLQRDIPWPDEERAPGSPLAGGPAAQADAPHALADHPETERRAGTRGLSPAEWDEPTVRESLAAGADVVLFSGDKLLGGPQAGVLVGRAELLARLRRDPIARAVRPDKLTLAGLEATLRLYRDPETLCRRLPVYRMLSATPAALERCALRLEQALLRAVPGAELRCAPDNTEAGGGSLPTIEFPTWVVRVRLPAVSAARAAAALRQRQAPVICRVHDEALVFDCRTLLEGEIDEIASAVAEVFRDLSPGP